MVKVSDKGGQGDKSGMDSMDVIDLEEYVRGIASDVEALKESSLARDEFHEQGIKYIKDLEKELDAISIMRYWAVRLTLIMIISFFGGAVYFAILPPEWFQKSDLESSVKIGFIIALMGGAVLLMAMILRGVFRTRSDRHHDGGMLPEGLRVLMEANK